MHSFWWLLGVLHHVIWVATMLITSQAMPPPPPIQCDASTGCSLSNSYGVWGDRTDCHVPSAAYPQTEEDLRLAVAFASKNKIKIKVVSKFSHTIPKLACPDMSFGDAMLISTANVNSTIEIDAANLAVRVDAGVGLRQLIDKVEEAGLSLVAAPYWEGVSVGGLISTGAHGSSWWGRGGAVHDHVIGLNLVVPANQSEGYAKVLRLDSKDEIFKAAKVSLGLLGIISKVKLRLEPAFKRSIAYNFTDDAQIEDIYMDHAKKYEFGDITWYPSKHTAAYRYDNRLPLTASGDGTYDFLGFQSNSVVVSKTIRATVQRKTMDSGRSSIGKCTLASTVLEAKKLVANGLKNNLIFTGYPVVGHQGKMQTSGSCLYSAGTDKSCAWDPRINGLFFYETTAIFPASKFADFIRDVKKLRDLKPENFCGVDIYNGFLIRFIRVSDAYLGQQENSVVVDFNYYRADDASTPRFNQDVWEEVEQLAFFKHGARPHWAKNRNAAFLDVQKKYPNFNKFLRVKRLLDPQNILSSEWSDEILSGKEGAKRDGCALEGLCVCSEDRHCSPAKGYFCKPGLVYKEARVCRYSSSPSSVGSESYKTDALFD